MEVVDILHQLIVTVVIVVAVVAEVECPGALNIEVCVISFCLLCDLFASFDN